MTYDDENIILELFPKTYFKRPLWTQRQVKDSAISDPVNISPICVKPRLTPQLAILAIQLLKYLLCSFSSPRDLLKACSSWTPSNCNSRPDLLSIMTRIMSFGSKTECEWWVVWPCRLQRFLLFANASQIRDSTFLSCRHYDLLQSMTSSSVFENSFQSEVEWHKKESHVCSNVCFVRWDLLESLWKPAVDEI